MPPTVRIQSSLQIKGAVVDYASRPTNITGTVVTESAPAPGRVNVTPAGVLVDLSKLSTPGYYRIMNMSATSWIEYGIWVAGLSKFCPWGEMLPGESYTGRFSRNLMQEDTGSASVIDVDSIMLVSHGGNAEALLEAFEV